MSKKQKGIQRMSNDTQDTAAAPVDQTSSDVQDTQATDVVLDGGSADATKVSADLVPDAPKIEEIKTTEIKVGTLVDPNQGKLGTEASEATKVRTAAASTATPEEAPKSQFEAKLQSINESGSDREKFVASMIGEYIKHMAPGIPVGPDEGYRRQLSLMRTIVNIIETDDDFTKAFRLLIAFVREHRKTVFDDKYAYRFFEFARPNDTGPKILTNLITMLIVAAGLQNKREIKKFVSLDKALSLGISDAGRQRVIQYFNS